MDKDTYKDTDKGPDTSRDTDMDRDMDRDTDTDTQRDTDMLNKVMTIPPMSHKKSVNYCSIFLAEIGTPLKNCSKLTTYFHKNF
jgi:hypothetical protein